MIAYGVDLRRNVIGGELLHCLVILLLVLGALSSLTCMSMNHAHIESFENVKGGLLLHR